MNLQSNENAIEALNNFKMEFYTELEYSDSLKVPNITINNTHTQIDNNKHSFNNSK